ncbi:unnamed protein product [Closterium sp. NIES-54]
MLPYLFPDLSSFTTAEDLISHLRASDARFCAALSDEFLAENHPPMYLTLYFLITRLPDTLCSVRDHFLALDPTTLTVADFETHLLAAEKNILAVGAARGTPRTPLFEGCSPPFLPPPTPLLLLLSTTLVLRRSGLLPLLVGSAAALGTTGVAREVEVAVEGAVVEAAGVVEVVGVVVGVEVVVRAAGVPGAVEVAAAGVGEEGSVVAAVVGAGVELARRGAPVVARDSSSSTSRGASGGPVRCTYIIRTSPRTGRPCTSFHMEYRCFSRLSDAWRTKFPEATEFPPWADQLRHDVPTFNLDYDAILAAMYALTVSVEGDCYLCMPPDPGIEPATLGASESVLPGTASAQALHTFTLDSGASRCFFRDSTTVTPLPAPVPISLADPSGGPVLARFTTVLPCPAVPSGELSGLHLPSFSTNLVSNAVLQNHWVDTFTLGGQRVEIYTCSRTGRHLATFTRVPGSSLYTLTTTLRSTPLSPHLYASAQVATQCECHRLSHQTLLWHHRLGHPSLPRLRGMHSRLLVSGLPWSLPSLPRSPAPPCIPCVKGRQRAAPHSSSFPPTEAPLQTLHLDVWGLARVRGQGHEWYFLLVVDDYTRYTTVFPLQRKGDVPAVLTPWIRDVRLQLRERFESDFPVLRLHSNRGGEFSSDLLRAYCEEHGIRQTFTVPASPQQNGVAERCIGLVMEVARTSMIHAAAPHFLWPFAVRYAAHQLNLWPRVSMPETSPTLRWTGKVGDALRFRVWGARAFVRDTTLPSRHSQRLAPSGVSQVDPAPLTEPVEVTGDSGPTGGGPARGAASGGAEPGGAEPGCAEPEREEPGGAELEGAEPGGVEPGREESGGAEPGGTECGCAAPGGTEAPGEQSPWSGCLHSRSAGASPQHSRRRGGVGGSRAGDFTTGGASTGVTGATGPRGARTGGTGAAEAGGTTGSGVAATRDTEAGDSGAGSAGSEGAAAGGAGPGGAGAGGSGAAGGADTGGAGAGGSGATGGARAGGAGAGGSGAAGGAGATGAGGTAQPLLFFAPPSPSSLPPPDPVLRKTGSLAERCEPASRPVSPVLTVHTGRTGRRVPRERPPAVPVTHLMALRPSSAPQLVPLPSPPTSSLPDVPDPESNHARAASPTVTRLLATVVTDPSFESTTMSALVPELVEFAAPCRLDYAASLVAESESVCPPSLRGDCALGTDVFEDKQEDFECLEAAVPHLVAMLLARKGDPDAPDIRTPRSYAEAIVGEYSAQWQAAMDAEMASWKSTGTYVDEAPPRGANIVDGMWIYRVKRPPGSPPVFKARYVARGFSQRQGVDFFQTFSPTPKMTTLRWHDTLRTTLAALGFAPSTADPSLFLRTDTSLPQFYILVYVDDLVFATANTEALALVKLELQKRHTTSGMGLVLGGRSSVVLTRHLDASWVDDLATQRLSQVYTFSLGSGSVSWQSTRSSSVLSSSCEAEIYATAMAAQELRWLTYLLNDLGERPRSPPALYVANKAAIAFCQEHRLEHRTKHIALRYFFARELQQRGQLRLAHVATRANTVDVFTKALPSGDHQRFCTLLGLVPTFPNLL